MNSKYKYAIGVEISLNMSPSLAGPPTGTLFQTIITAGRNFYLKLFKVEGWLPMIRRLVSHYKLISESRLKQCQYCSSIICSLHSSLLNEDNDSRCIIRFPKKRKLCRSFLFMLIWNHKVMPSWMTLARSDYSSFKEPSNVWSQVIRWG